MCEASLTSVPILNGAYIAISLKTHTKPFMFLECGSKLEYLSETQDTDRTYKLHAEDLSASRQQRNHRAIMQPKED